MSNKILTLFLFLVPTIIFAQSSYTNEERIKVLYNGQKYNTFLYYLDRGYLEDIDVDKLTEKAIQAVLSELDPHSSYISKEELKSIDESFQGNFEGIGIEFNVLQDTVIVVNTVSGGPSERVGLKAGDRIVKVDTVSVIGITQTQVPKYLRGPKGSKVELTVIRHSEIQPLIFTVERDKIPVTSLDAGYKLNDSTGYIKINRFMATTSDEFDKAMDEMPNIKNLVLDLRGNGGGLLDQAIKLADNFLPQGALIVYTEGRSMPKTEAFAQNSGRFQNGNLVILLDEESASASEIVAGAIQDWDRGIVIGRTSFGKGLVQRQMTLPDSSAIRITVARYHTPSGRIIQRPFRMGDAKEYYMNYMKRYTNGELINPDSIPNDIPDALKFKTVRLGRTVYGGGGITPDIFVPIDTSQYSKYWGKLVGAGIITDYVVDYVDKHRHTLEKRYPSFDVFDKEYAVTDDMFDALESLGEKKEIAREPEEMTRIKPIAGKQLKALIAQKLWSTNEYFRVINADNDMIKAALKSFNNL